MAHSDNFRELKQRAIDARLERDQALRDVRIEEMYAVFRFLDGNQLAYEELGKNEEIRTLQRMRILEHDEAYRVCRNNAIAQERAYLEAEADLDAYLEVRRIQREDLQRAQIEQGALA